MAGNANFSGVVAEFELDVQIITDVEPGDAAAPCDTSDGCDPTCASSCTSGS